MKRIGVAEDYARWAREALPMSVERVQVLRGHPGPGDVTLLVRWRPHVFGTGRATSRAIVRDYCQARAPVNVVVHVESANA